MRYFARFIEKIFWGVIWLAVFLIVLYAILHILRQNNLTGGVASWIGSHTTNY
jgi:hypothetical protein